MANSKTIVKGDREVPTSNDLTRKAIRINSQDVPPSNKFDRPETIGDPNPIDSWSRKILAFS